MKIGSQITIPNFIFYISSYKSFDFQYNYLNSVLCIIP